MDAKDFDKEVEINYSTSGHKKFIRYCEEIFNSKPFKDKITELRKKYLIPENGFENGKSQRFPPTKWILKDEKERKNLSKELKKLCEKYHLHYMDTLLILEPYLFYNDLDLKNIVYERNALNLCYIADLAEEAKEPYGKEFRDSDNMAFPIAIRISPYASERDILDFIKKMYKTSIGPMQKTYQNEDIKLGSHHKKNEKIRERNDFIYNNRKDEKGFRSYKELAKMVQEKFGGSLLDYAYIGKIISLERKRRKEV